MTPSVWLLLALVAGIMTMIWIGWAELEAAVLGALATVTFLIVALVTWLVS